MKHFTAEVHVIKGVQPLRFYTTEVSAATPKEARKLIQHQARREGNTYVVIDLFWSKHLEVTA